MLKYARKRIYAYKEISVMKSFINIAKVLSDETRLRILRVLMLADRPLCICEIVDSLELAQYNVSRHMKELKVTGLVSEQKEGRFVFYSLLPQNDPGIRHMLKAVELIPDEYIASDRERLKKRLGKRVDGKCCYAGASRKG